MPAGGAWGDRRAQVGFHLYSETFGSSAFRHDEKNSDTGFQASGFFVWMKG